MKKLLTLTAAGLLASGLAMTATADGNARDEISTAHAHAVMAQNATTLDMAHTHLHHVINCLVGPEGEAFDASAGTPCKGQGNGAIPDSKDNATLQTKLESALADARTGLNADELAKVQSDAGKVAAALQATPTPKDSGG